ncbi:hypothetical protein [Wolbachia endosymbiont (group A) of Sphecodes monilicornis]|uniref:hypothetical protein n=1 Tax=Wolbachia endosymbiont (group A) of Sphecodes monilicornis TaxID=2954060 RepID=UPI002225F872|nr:hypothetical protein [Wolbachia endosymbiont (group A) of Sphecodes monilicornis]
MLLAFNLLIIIYPYPITSGLLWKELYFTNFASPLIMKLNLFIYLRNLCSGLMTKNLMYLA